MATDDFNRANNADLGANWTQVTSLAVNRLTINSNAARANSEAADAWNTPFDEDQSIQVTLGVLDGLGGHLWMLLNMTSPGMGSFTGYLLDMVQDNGSTCSLALYRGNGGSYTTLVSAVSGISYASGDTWYLEKVGDELTVKRNGTPVTSFDAVVDAAPLTGSTYLGIGSNTSSVLTVDDFVGLSIEGTPTNAPETLRLVQSNNQSG